MPKGGAKLYRSEARTVPFPKSLRAQVIGVGVYVLGGRCTLAWTWHTWLSARWPELMAGAANCRCCRPTTTRSPPPWAGCATAQPCAGQTLAGGSALPGCPLAEICSEGLPFPPSPRRGGVQTSARMQAGRCKNLDPMLAHAVSQRYH